MNQQSSNFNDGIKKSGDYQEYRPEAVEVPAKYIKPVDTSTTSEQVHPSLNYESIGKGGVTFDNSVTDEAEKSKAKIKADLSKEPS